MRDVMFRGKRLDNGEWAYGYLFGTWDKQYILWGMINKNPNMNEVYPNTVGEWTGLTDKNGVKIFEGDIIKNGDGIIGKEKINTVEYIGNHASFVRYHESQMGWQYLYINNNLTSKSEVIGNIHDNPELLRKE